MGCNPPEDLQSHVATCTCTQKDVMYFLNDIFAFSQCFLTYNPYSFKKACKPHVNL